MILAIFKYAFFITMIVVIWYEYFNRRKMS